jgi:hypothetical protein
MRLTKQQMSVAQAALDTTVFVEGIAGVGKTTAGVRRLRHLLEEGVNADSILVITPQRALAAPYLAEARNKKRKAGGEVTIATLGSLAYQTVNLFWPLISASAGFVKPQQPPVFLSLELTQYYMTRILGPEIEAKDYFNSVRIDRNRLYSQITDNLNKSALVGFPYQTIGERLLDAWAGTDVEQQYIYRDTQTSINLFREKCYQYNLLDFALQVDLFVNRLWSHPAPRNYLTKRYRHLIVDNVEEDNPAMHKVLGEWLPQCDSAVLLYDSDAGYRRFLGSDPENGYALRESCKSHLEIDKTYVMSSDMAALNQEIAVTLKGEKPSKSRKTDARDALLYGDNRYYTQMINWTAEHIARLVHDDGVPAQEIVVLAPLLSDALRFTLMNRLETLKVPVRSHRPSRALREEPAARALLTLAKVAHPQWGYIPDSYDVTYALMGAIQGLDLTRARLLTEIVYRQGTLSHFSELRDDMQQRITYQLGQRYDRLQAWLTEYVAAPAIQLDYFFSRLFGEVLSQPGFGFHAQFEAANTAANLIDSARNFRWQVVKLEEELDTGKEYIFMVDQGLLADLYVRDWQVEGKDSVLVTPAYTFLMSNRAVDYQFWLNIGSGNWAQRLYQPLTQPYVLSKHWEAGRKWTDEDEVRVNEDALYRLMTGLVRRCRQRIYLGYSQFGEQGYEQRGPLLETVQRILRRLSKEG